MKKLSTLLLAAGLFAFVACNNGAKNAEKAKQDSIKQADSLALVEKAAMEADSLAKVAEQMKADSTAKADSAAKAAEVVTAKPAAKKVVEPKKAEPKKEVNGLPKRNA